MLSRRDPLAGHCHGFNSSHLYRLLRSRQTSPLTTANREPLTTVNLTGACSGSETYEGRLAHVLDVVLLARESDLVMTCWSKQVGQFGMGTKPLRKLGRTRRHATRDETRDSQGDSDGPNQGLNCSARYDGAAAAGTVAEHITKPVVRGFAAYQAIHRGTSTKILCQCSFRHSRR
jgi:hypothetical protein